MAQSGKHDFLAYADDPPGNEEPRHNSEALREKSEDLRQYSLGLLSEAQNLCRASRLLRHRNLLLAAINPAPDARNKRFRLKSFRD